MTLTELFGDDPLKMSVEERAFLENAAHLWATQFEAIIRESRGPKIKTRIHVKKGKKKNG